MTKLPSKIFIDGGDPEETKAADRLFKKAGFGGVDGQTTNPTLIVKRFATMQQNNKVTKQQFNKLTIQQKQEKTIEFYKKTVQEIAKIIPHGPISIQVIGDPATLTKEEMLHQARERKDWILNAVIKFPLTQIGLAAAEVFCQEGSPNMTLAFSQEQAAAAYIATKAHNYDVYVSPFVGRLDDRGEKGMDVVANIIEMYKKFGDNHVKVLTASVRSVAHILYALWLKSDVITIPFKVFKEWENQGFPLPPADFVYDAGSLAEIPYKELSLDVDWHDLNIHHPLTDAGLTKFWEDWKSIVG